MKNKTNKYFLQSIVFFTGLWLYTLFLVPCTAQQMDMHRPYMDLTHYSKVFGQQRYYRLYLPSGYQTSSKKYPVIYFFHGWGGRYFKDVNAKLEYAKIKKLVDKFQVILVMGDGTMDGKEPNPYNVGNHDDVKFTVQYKDYFPELIAYIDAHYQTMADRKHRAIIGFSMGGFISLFMAGAYPDKVCAVMSFAGSAELFVGYPGSQTLYPLRYTFKNLQNMDVRMHNGNSDILFYLNKEVYAGAVWEGKKMQYWNFNGGHMIDQPGQTVVFEKGMKFVMDAFKKTWPAPNIWSHYDVYPKFKIWDYRVSSDKKDPGFLFLKNVGKNGFGVYAPRWLPDGPSIAPIHISVTTAPIYRPDKYYDEILYIPGTDTVMISSLKSDKQGKMTVALDGPAQVGIADKKSLPEFVFVDYTINDHSRYLTSNQHNLLGIRLLNRGGEGKISPSMRIALSVNDPSIHIADSVKEIKLPTGQRIISVDSFLIFCNKTAPPHGEPSQIKFTITQYSGNKIFTDDFIVPVLYDVPYFDSIVIDDGALIRDSLFGMGDGSGTANPGENILVYQGLHRLRLYTADPFVIGDSERLSDEMIPARWPDGVTLSSVIKISPDCPDGHEISCVACYETKTFNPIERKVIWGKIRIIVHRNH